MPPVSRWLIIISAVILLVLGVGGAWVWVDGLQAHPLGVLLMLVAATLLILSLTWQSHLMHSYQEASAAEAARRTIEMRYSVTLMSLGDGVIATDASGRVELLNPVAAALTGWSLEEARGRPLNEVFRIIHEGTRLEVESPVARVLREGTVVGLANHTLLIRRDGQEVPITDSGAPIRDESGAMYGVVLVFRDQSKERRMEIALHESEERLRSLYNAMTEVVVLHELVYDAEGKPCDYRILDCNPEFTQTTGISREQAVGNLASEVYGGAAPYLDIYARVAETGVATNFDTYFPPMDKYFSIAVFSPGKGRFATVSSDITVRKRVEDALRASEHQLQEAQQIAHLGSWTLDLATNQLTWSDEVFRIFEIDPHSFAASYDTFLATIHPEDREKVNAAYRQSVLDHSPYNIVHRLKMSDGRIKFVRERCRTIYDEAGDCPLRSVGTVQDITVSAQTEALLRESEAQYRSYVNNAPDGVFIANERGRYIDVNPAACRITGYPKAELLTLTISDLLAPEFVEAGMRHFTQVVAEGRAEGEFMFVCRDQTRRWWVVNAVKLSDTRFLGFVADTTERKLAEEQVKHALQEKELLLRELYHRTKNNMQVISSMLALQSAHSNCDEVRELVQAIDNKIQAMALVHQMLYQSQDLSRIDLRAYIQEVAHLAFSSYQTTSAKIALSMSLSSLRVTIDMAIPMGLLLNELFSNAFKHAFPNGQQGRISLSLYSDETRAIYLEFSDDGVGVPEHFDLRSQRTYGLRSVFGIAEHQLGGEVNITLNPGVAYAFRFPEAGGHRKL